MLLPTAVPHASGSRLTQLTPAALHGAEGWWVDLRQFNQGTKYVLENSLTGHTVRWAGAREGFPKFFREVVLLTSGKQLTVSQGRKETEKRNWAPNKHARRAWGPRQGHIARQEDGRRDETFAWGPVIQQMASLPIWLQDRWRIGLLPAPHSS